MAFLSRKAMAATFKGGGGIPSVVSTDAEGWWHADGLASAASWTNSGTTGSTLDVDTVVGSSANFSISNTLNGIACWDTGGTGGCLRTSGAPTYNTATFFMVYQWQTVPTGYRFIYDGESTTASLRNVYYYDQVTGTQHGWNGGTSHGAGTLSPDGDIHCVQHKVVNSSGTDTIWQTVEGDQLTGGGLSSWKGFTIAGYPGGLYYADIKIGEMILFDRSVTAQEEEAIRKYLIAKWGTVGAWND